MALLLRWVINFCDFYTHIISMSEDKSVQKILGSGWLPNMYATQNPQHWIILGKTSLWH